MEQPAHAYAAPRITFPRRNESKAAVAAAASLLFLPFPFLITKPTIVLTPLAPPSLPLSCSLARYSSASHFISLLRFSTRACSSFPLPSRVLLLRVSPSYTKSIKMKFSTIIALALAGVASAQTSTAATQAPGTGAVVCDALYIVRMYSPF